MRPEARAATRSRALAHNSRVELEANPHCQFGFVAIKAAGRLCYMSRRRHRQLVTICRYQKEETRAPAALCFITADCQSRRSQIAPVTAPAASEFFYCTNSPVGSQHLLLQRQADTPATRSSASAPPSHLLLSRVRWELLYTHLTTHYTNNLQQDTSLPSVSRLAPLQSG